MAPFSVMASHQELKPTLEIVLATNTTNTTSELSSRFRKAWKKELGKKSTVGMNYLLAWPVATLTITFAHIAEVIYPY